MLLSCVPLILVALVFFVVLAFGAVVLLSLALRYRAGTARRQGRRWAATMNVWMTAFSAVFFLCFSFHLIGFLLILFLLLWFWSQSLRNLHTLSLLYPHYN